MDESELKPYETETQEMVCRAMCRDYYVLEFMDPSVDTAPIAPALAEYFDDVLGQSVSKLNFGVRPSCLRFRAKTLNPKVQLHSLLAPVAPVAPVCLGEARHACLVPVLHLCSAPEFVSGHSRASREQLCVAGCGLIGLCPAVSGERAGRCAVPVPFQVRPGHCLDTSSSRCGAANLIQPAVVRPGAAYWHSLVGLLLRGPSIMGMHALCLKGPPVAFSKTNQKKAASWQLLSAELPPSSFRLLQIQASHGWASRMGMLGMAI